MKYLWTDGVSKPAFEKLTGSIKTDVLIIGGGMAGILCAKALQDTGIDYVLVEGREIGNGITKGTTAVITAQHDLLYSDLMDKYGKKKTKMYLDANLSAVSRFKEHAKTIECDFEILPSVMYSVSDGEKMQKEAKAVKSLGFDAEYITDVPLPVKIKGGVRYPDMAQFHPLRFLYGLAEGLNVFENTYVTKLEGTTAFTHNGTIRAKKIIVATHFLYKQKRVLFCKDVSETAVRAGCRKTGSRKIRLQSGGTLRGGYVFPGLRQSADIRGRRTENRKTKGGLFTGKAVCKYSLQKLSRKVFLGESGLYNP